ncbi:MAG: DGQHR domain-containing protein DpdB [Chloroflexota bacterium]
MSRKLTFSAIKAEQSPQHTVFSFAASATQVFEMGRIERAGRSDAGVLSGFQRPQIAAHIHEIRDYLQREDAVLPNSIVVAFTDHVKIHPVKGNVVTIEIDITDGPPGLIVDGQQRLSALAPLNEKSFEVFVSGILCKTEEELRRQFILINNTRPLPKELIYELLPGISELPERMSSRSMASALTQRLNFDSKSSLYRQIHLHTNPNGTIANNAIQRVIMMSRSHGALRILSQSPDGDEKCFQLMSDFYGAVQAIFKRDWHGLTPKTSRLVHSVGIISMGRVMEVAFQICQARDFSDFCGVLQSIQDQTHWTQGKWVLGNNDNVRERAWNEFQSTHPDIQLLSDHLDRLVRQSYRKQQESSEPQPLRAATG